MPETYKKYSMVERSRRSKGKRKLLGSHQRCWIWGRNVVGETLAAGRWPIVELRLADRLPEPDLEWAQEAADSLDVPVRVEPWEALTKQIRSSEHQGYLAKMTSFPYWDVDDVFETAGETPLFAVLDAVQDPFNYGAILRSTEALGVDGVFVGQRHQSEVTALVARTSAGAINHVPLARAESLTDLAGRLAEAGVRLVGTDHDAPLRVDAAELTGGVALVVGNEGVGVTPEVAACCEAFVRIPQRGNVGSLNAAVAAGILFYEAQRQRSPE